MLPLQWYIKKCSPTQIVASDFWVGVIDHQRAFAVRICRMYLLMRLQDAQNYIASLSRAQLVYLCTGVLPGGPVQVSLHLLTILLFISHTLPETLSITMLNKLNVFAVHAALGQKLRARL